jgi:hypothetical protein
MVSCQWGGITYHAINSQQPMWGTIDHCINGHVVSIDDAFITDKYSNQHRHKTTNSWELLIWWKGGTTSWDKLADLKDSRPPEVAEYAVANKIVEQPAFVWWAKQALKKRDRHIQKAKSC